MSDIEHLVVTVRDSLRPRRAELSSPDLHSCLRFSFRFLRQAEDIPLQPRSTNDSSPGNRIRDGWNNPKRALGADDVGHGGIDRGKHSLDGALGSNVAERKTQARGRKEVRWENLLRLLLAMGFLILAMRSMMRQRRATKP